MGDGVANVGDAVRRGRVSLAVGDMVGLEVGLAVGFRVGTVTGVTPVPPSGNGSPQQVASMFDRSNSQTSSDNPELIRSCNPPQLTLPLLLSNTTIGVSTNRWSSAVQKEHASLAWAWVPIAMEATETAATDRAVESFMSLDGVTIVCMPETNGHKNVSELV